MSDGFRVNHDELARMADVLRSTGSALEGTATTMPGQVDAGLGGPAVYGLLSRMAAGAGEVVTATATAGAMVDDSNAAYLAVEEQNTLPPPGSAF